MKYGTLIIEKKEYVLLKRFMNLSGYYSDSTFWKSVQKLLKELETAQVREEAEMPEDVIRFYSTVTIASDNGWQRQLKLVMPKDSDVKNHKVSILTPMGAALIGYAEGDTLEWEFPSGKKTLTIQKVMQETKQINVNMVL